MVRFYITNYELSSTTMASAVDSCTLSRGKTVTSNIEKENENLHEANLPITNTTSIRHPHKVDQSFSVILGY
jgi:hypothetical protein